MNESFLNLTLEQIISDRNSYIELIYGMYPNCRPVNVENIFAGIADSHRICEIALQKNSKNTITVKIEDFPFSLDSVFLVKVTPLQVNIDGSQESLEAHKPIYLLKDMQSNSNNNEL